MKAPALNLLLLSALLLSACEGFEPPLAPDLEAKGISTYQDPLLLVSELNEQLRKAGAPGCSMKTPNLKTGYARKIPNQGAAVCKFSDGIPLFVLIVRNGEETYERHFSSAHGPNVYLRGPTWIMITPHTAPPEALAEIRRWNS